MKHRRSAWIRVAIGGSAFLVASSAMSQPNYSVEQVEIPGSLNAWSSAYVNDSGQIMIEDANDQGNGNTHYLVEGAQITPFTGINVRDFNDQGQVVGGCYSQPVGGACIWSQTGGITLIPGIPLPDGSYANPREGRDINDSGQVAGWAQGEQFGAYAFFWDPNTGMQIIGNGWGNVIADNGAVQADTYSGSIIWKDGQTLYSGTTMAYGLNNNYYNYSGNQLWDPVNLFQDMGNFLASGSANAINNSNQIAGKFTDSNRAALWDNGVVYDLNDLIPANSGWVLEAAHDINEAGDVVGIGKLNGSDAIFLLSLPKNDTPPQYTIASIDIGERAVPRAINSDGKVVGYVPPTQSGPSKGFSWNESTGVSYFGFYHSQGHAINDAGAVGGNSGSSNVRYSTTVWNEAGTRITLGGSGAIYGLNDNGYATGSLFAYGARLWNFNTRQMEYINSLGGTYTYPMEVNNHNIVVGYSQINRYRYRAFIYDSANGTRELVINDSTGNTYANDINDSGEIVGSAYTASESLCYGWCGYVSDSSGNWHVLPSLDANSGNGASAINEQSQIVGSSAGKATIWVNGEVFDLNNYIPAGSNWVLSGAVDISENGKIVGTGTLDGISKIFVLTPIQ